MDASCFTETLRQARRSAGVLASGRYYLTASPGASGSATLGTGTLRLAPWLVPNKCTIVRIGADVAVAGDAGSKFRLGLYADDGTGYPGAKLLDAGTINGDSATVQELTVSLVLAPGVYWVGGVAQVVTTTQPTMRITNHGPNPPLIPLGTSIPAANLSAQCVTQPGVTGALPDTFTATIATGTAAPRCFVKVG